MNIAAVQRCRPGGRRQPIADAAVAAILTVGGLVLAGAATSGPPPGPDALPSGAQRTATVDGPDRAAARTVR